MNMDLISIYEVTVFELTTLAYQLFDDLLLAFFFSILLVFVSVLAFCPQHPLSMPKHDLEKSHNAIAISGGTSYSC